MHILFLNPQGNFDPEDSHLTEHPDFGGQLVYVKELAEAMAQLGHHADIITRQMDDDDWPEFSGALESYPGYEERVRIVRLPCGGPEFLPKEQLWEHLGEWVGHIREFFGPARPDFATGHYADGGYAAALLKQQTGIGFTFTGHSLGAQKLDKMGTTAENWPQMEEEFRFSRRIHAERLSMEHASRIVTSTSQERDEQYGHPLYEGAIDAKDLSRFAVIPPGVNTRVFSADPAPDDDPVQQQISRNLAGIDGPVVVVSSRLDEKKNIAGVVDAFVSSDALRDKAGLVLCIRGMDDPYAEVGSLPQSEQDVLGPILKSIEDAGMKDRVGFLNLHSQRELAAAYRALGQRGSVFALTAFYEPFGLAPIEAAACGLACAATQNGGPSEIFEDGSGVLVDPFDADDIARGLLEALENQSDLAKRSADRVHSTYTWIRTAQRYLEVIEGEAAKGTAPIEPLPALDAGDRIGRYLAAGGEG